MLQLHPIELQPDSVSQAETGSIVPEGVLFLCETDHTSHLKMRKCLKCENLGGLTSLLGTSPGYDDAEEVLLVLLAFFGLGTIPDATSHRAAGLAQDMRRDEAHVVLLLGIEGSRRAAAGKGMGLIMLILIGTVPTAYALNRALGSPSQPREDADGCCKMAKGRRPTEDQDAAYRSVGVPPPRGLATPRRVLRADRRRRDAAAPSPLHRKIFTLHVGILSASAQKRIIGACYDDSSSAVAFANPGPAWRRRRNSAKDVELFG
jgi:hypothetical protein